MFQFYPAILAAILYGGSCLMPTIVDDSQFTDPYPTTLLWAAGSATVGSIEMAFNEARAGDSTVTTLLRLPAQEVWDAMNNQEKVLYLLNKERYDRGIKPFEGYSPDVIGVAQNYAQLLYDSNTFGHLEDGTPRERLNRVESIAASQDLFYYTENLAPFPSAGDYTEEPIAQAVFGWMYHDASFNWEHRNACLVNDLNDNSGENGKEGLIGIGVVQGTEYTGLGFQGSYTTLIVINAFDPGEDWDHSSTREVSLCADTPVQPSQFQIHYENGTIIDTQEGLTWMLRPVANTTLDEALTTCNTSSHADFDDWYLADQAQAGAFHFTMDLEKRNPPQFLPGSIAEIVSDGHVRTKAGSIKYGLNPGDPITFIGKANVRCVRSSL